MNSDCEIRNALIESTSIDIGDGHLTVWLRLNYGDQKQSFGGYSLYLPKGYKYHDINSYAGHFMYRCMEIAGVRKWEYMDGQTIRVRIKAKLISAIGHIINDDWFCPKDDFVEKE